MHPREAVNLSSKFIKMQLHSIAPPQSQEQETQPPTEEAPPATRPVIIVGPSLKGFEVTDMLQEPIFEHLQERFEGKVIIKCVTADISQAGNPETSTDEIEAEMEQIKKLTASNKLVVLNCDTINYPYQLSRSTLKPIIVYLKIKNPNVLRKLIKSRGRTEIQNMDIQMAAAEKLAQCPNNMFDVVLDDGKLEDVCEHLTTYLLANMPVLS